MVKELNRWKWFGSRPVMWLDNPGGAGGAGGGAGAGGGSGTGGNTGGTGAGDSGAGAGGSGAGQGGGAAASGGTGTIDWKTAPEHFRKGYEDLKAKHEPFEKLGIQPDQFAGVNKHYTAVITEAKGLADELGYDEAELMAVIEEKGLLPTLDGLRNLWDKQQNGEGGDPDPEAELNERITAGLDKALGPMRQQENKRRTDEANGLFERTAHTEMAAAFKEEGVDITKVAPEEQFMLINAASELFKYDDAAIHALKYEGKTAPIQKAIREAKVFLDKYFMARATRERGMVAGGGRRQDVRQQDNGGGGKRPTLDEMTENPDLIRTSRGAKPYDS